MRIAEIIRNGLPGEVTAVLRLVQIYRAEPTAPDHMPGIPMGIVLAEQLSIPAGAFCLHLRRKVSGHSDAIHIAFPLQGRVNYALAFYAGDVVDVAVHVILEEINAVPLALNLRFCISSDADAHVIPPRNPLQLPGGMR